MIKILVLLLFSITTKLYAYNNAIYDVSDLNGDSTKDTIILNSTNGFISIDKIYWGSSTFTTYIKYPELFYLKNYFWNYDINKDGLKDIVILSSGTIDTIDYKDTAYFKVIYGQSGLETIDTIKISEIDSIQFTPFVATTIYANSGISQGKIQSMSSIPVFEVYYTDFDTQDTLLQKNVFNDPKEIIITKYNVYPNPAYIYTNLELIDIQEGNYSIEIRKLNSHLMDKIDLKIDNITTLTKYLDLKDYSTGTYLITIKTENKILENIKLIVIK